LALREESIEKLSRSSKHFL